MPIFLDRRGCRPAANQHVRSREAHPRLHLSLPRRDRARGRPRQAAHHQEPRPQGGRYRLRHSRAPGQFRRPLRRAGRGSLPDRGRQPRGARLHAHRRAPAVRAPVGGDRLPRGGRGSPLRAGLRVCGRARCLATVLHRIMVSGSDRAWEKWLSDYDIPGLDGLGLHHLYRTMAWLGEELPSDQQGGATPFAPRTVKDLIEEQRFARRRDLFSELSVVFLDTTSLSFTGAGGERLGERGYSKDHRPDLMQMIVGVVIDAAGRPVCSEMWPGNTADVSVLVPVIDRLRRRFAIGRVCVVADRGMICAKTIAALEDRGLEYVLGARERTDSLVRTVVLADQRPFTPLCITRAGGEETQLFEGGQS